MLNGDEGLLSIILAGRGPLVKKLITFEPHVIYYLIKICILIHFNIIETQVCKTVTRLRQEKCRSEQNFARKMSVCCSQTLKLDFETHFIIRHYTTLTNFSTIYLVMCKVYTDIGGIK